VKLHLLCATNRVPISYQLTPANVADVCLTEELIAEAALGDGVARRLLADLAYSSEDLREALALWLASFWRPSEPSGGAE
jgi:hypothetical protein